MQELFVERVAEKIHGLTQQQIYRKDRTPFCQNGSRQRPFTASAQVKEDANSAPSGCQLLLQAKGRWTWRRLAGLKNEVMMRKIA